MLLSTATAFLQGFYPPLESTNSSLATDTINNGSSYTKPLDGYEYVVVHGEEETSPDHFWLKGDEGCPAYQAARNSFKDSAEFQSRQEATRTFYEGFWDILDNVHDYTREKMSYRNAFDIFDLINVATIHNESMESVVTEDELFQLRTLADSAEFNMNYNRTQPTRSIGGQTLAGAVLRQLNDMIAKQGALKFALFVGSYDTFLSFFGLANLTAASADFYGLPSYASTMAFELFTDDDDDDDDMTSFPANIDDLNVRFLFRNGSDDGSALTPYPLFGQGSPSMPWRDFSREMTDRAIGSVAEWCTVCSSTEAFCPPYMDEKEADQSASGSGRDGGGISNAVAGVIGAVVTLVVVGIVGALAFWMLKRRAHKRSSAAAAARTRPAVVDKMESFSSGSSGEV